MSQQHHITGDSETSATQVHVWPLLNHQPLPRVSLFQLSLVLRLLPGQTRCAHRFGVLEFDFLKKKIPKQMIQMATFPTETFVVFIASPRQGPQSSSSEGISVPGSRTASSESSSFTALAVASSSSSTWVGFVYPTVSNDVFEKNGMKKLGEV